MQMYGSFFWRVRCMYAFPGSSGWSSNSPHQHPVVHLLQMTSPLIVLTPQTVSTNVMLQVCIYTHTKACACGSSSCINTVLTVLMMQLQEQSLPVRHTHWTHLINTYCHRRPWFLLLITSVNLSKWRPQFHPSSRWVRLCWAWSRTSRWLFPACCLVGIRCPRGSGCTTTAWWGHREELDF